MAKWIRKVKHDLTSFRVSIPTVLITKLGWESCRYVTIEVGWNNQIIITRLPGDEKRGDEGSQHSAGAD